MPEASVAFQLILHSSVFTNLKQIVVVLAECEVLILTFGPRNVGSNGRAPMIYYIRKTMCTLQGPAT